MTKIYVANLPKRGKEGDLSESETIVQVGRQRYQFTEWLTAFFQSSDYEFQKTLHQLMVQKKSGSILEQRSAQMILDLIPAKNEDLLKQEGLI